MKRSFAWRNSFFALSHCFKADEHAALFGVEAAKTAATADLDLGFDKFFHQTLLKLSGCFFVEAMGNADLALGEAECFNVVNQLFDRFLLSAYLVKLLKVALVACFADDADTENACHLGNKRADSAVVGSSMKSRWVQVLYCVIFSQMVS